MTTAEAIVLGAVAFLVLPSLLRPPVAQSSIPQNQANPYPTGGVQYPPAQSQYSGYGDLAAGIGTGLGSLFTGIGNMVNSNQGSYSSGY